MNKEGYFLHINPSVINTLGYTKKELLSQPVSRLVHEDDLERTRLARLELLKGAPLVNFQNRYLSKEGAVIWLQWTSVFLPEKEVVFAIAKNITKSKLDEMETASSLEKYKELTAHFKHVVEKDRHFIASELHEEIGQLATVIKMDLESMDAAIAQMRLPDKKHTEHTIATAQKLIDRIRTLSYSINPSQINDIGLDLMIRSMCDEFYAQTSISCTYESNFVEEKIDHEIKLDLYRICQEALSNVTKHAQATKVKIRLFQKGNKLELVVKDNGKGFEHVSKQTFGLKSMLGRAASINGDFDIRSTKSTGTTVSVSVNT